MSDHDDDDPAPETPELEQPPQFDAGDPAAVGKRATALKLRAKESERFWQAVFASKVGRREMFGLLRDCGAFETTFACGPNGFPQPEATWFKAGQAEFGRRMRDTWVVTHTAAFALMLAENSHDHAKDGK